MTTNDLNDKDWQKLIRNIERGKCILMLGSDIPLATANGDEPSLTTLLSRQLAEYISGKAKIFDSDDLPHVAYNYLANRIGDRDDLEMEAENFYRGYQIDALLLSDRHGAIIFHLIEGAYNQDIEIADIQDESYTKLESKLKQHKDLTKGRNLAVELSVATFAPAWVSRPDINANYPILVTDDDLTNFLSPKKWDDNQTYQKLVSVIQSITTIRNRNKRGYVKKTDSKGAKLNKLEESIANLDRQQSTAVIETVEGVQRIRGLAGSGKTIVLALKVAYLHSKNPDWHIAVTFNSRSLKNQFKHFITLFILEHKNEEPDWDKIDIIHARGSPLSCPTVFKVIDPALFEVSQYILTRAIVGRTHTEDSVRQDARF